MAPPHRRGAGLSKSRLRTLGLLLIGFGLAAWAAAAAGKSLLAAGRNTMEALWLLPALMALNLVQLLLSARAWQAVIIPAPALSRLFALRIIREGIDSLLPVAQVGGEVVGAKLLTDSGVPAMRSAASTLVDVTAEFVGQLAFLLAGLSALAAISPAGEWERWAGAAAACAMLAGGLIAAQRFGLLRMLEALARRLAQSWPQLGDLDGLHEEVASLYARPARIAGAAALHLLTWALGTAESWAVLSALDLSVTWTDALVIESLGMAARSAGFAIPGALAVQETGFALAAGAVGLPESAGLALSLVKRVREIGVGLLGLLLWWAERRALRHTPV